ncbi:YheC/YheD family protein [Paenibacillus thermotolerans]|uniref:YheC/YheD family endospore coat-associated protein n=1 Tax=Paenibacillus thermotolerans TaxID=3027807 RepID=UPI002367B843|nr:MULTISPECIES: YheC/YheD family protein [unclassified Paenibacillus]
MGFRKETNGSVGILVRETFGPVPFAERSFYRKLSLAGSRLGINVFVFSPEWIDWTDKTVNAFAYSPEGKAWIRSVHPLPSLVYDRSFSRTRQQRLRYKRQLSRLLSVPGVRLLGRGLGGKYDVYRMLKQDEAVSRLLPRTEPYRGPSSLLSWLEEYKEVIMKPNGGMHGKGVFRVSRETPEEYAVCGRDKANRVFRRRFAGSAAASGWIHRIVSGRTYLLQPYLSLSTEGGYPFDLRALVQKGGNGSWSLTGIAVRLGPKNSVTSNLHGGGTAADAEPFLAQEYGEEKAAAIAAGIRSASLAVPPVLERHHGPLVELGIDFGVDRLGRIWLLEVNSKPGRSSFLSLANRRASAAAVTSPIRYARYVLGRATGRI